MRFTYKGLTDAQIAQAREKDGTNALTKKESETFWQKYIGNFNDPIIKILCVALIINVIFACMGKAEWYESVGIAAAVLIATFVSTWSEYSNENAFQKLQEDASKITTKVFRNGKIQNIMIDDVVNGDILLLQTGDMIPADGKLIDGEINVDQSTLNGESKEATKIQIPDGYIDTDETVDFLNKYNLFRGTVVLSGEAVMEVTKIGDKSVYGELAQEMQAEGRQSPLTLKLEKLAGQISLFGYIGGILIAVAYFFQHAVMNNHFNGTEISKYFSIWANPVNDIVTAIILGVIVIVVAVPEGLPMMIAMVLSLNMRKMLKDNVLVRKLIGIETAGSLNILFSDKTGTITKGELEVIEFVNGVANSYQNYDGVEKELKKLVHLSLTQNTNAIVGDKTENGKFQIIGGNSTEKAALGFINHNEPIDFAVNRVKEIPFSSDKKYSATQVQGDYNLTLIKGAPEKIIPNCKFYYDENGKKQPFANLDKINSKMQMMANRAIRVLAIATSEHSISDLDNFDDLVLVGVLGIRDDVRPEAVKAISNVQNAGVQVVMVTGDRKETAMAIAKEAGLIHSENDIITDPNSSLLGISKNIEICLSSDELQKLSDNDLKKLLPNIRVIARALPTDKSRLVRVAQEMNLVVGMTGDGVNDSPALKKADVGFAMGTGTEVAKEAGDIVILDDNFQSIAKAILYGRTIFNSIRKFIIFQLTINVSAVLVSFICPFLGINEALSVTQMLWVNLVMDTLAALAFGGEPALQEFMLEHPKKRDENIVSKYMWSSILIIGAFCSAVSIFFLTSPVVAGLFRHDNSGQNIYLMTGFFSFFILSAVMNSFNTRTTSLNLFDHITENKGFLKVMGAIALIQILMTFFGGVVLRTKPLTISEWLVVLGFSLLVIPVDMLRKNILKISCSK